MRYRGMMSRSAHGPSRSRLTRGAAPAAVPLLLFLTTLLGGCLGGLPSDAGGASTGAQDLEIDHPEVRLLSLPDARQAQPGESWGTLRLRAEGGPGTYLVAYQPLPEGASDVPLQVTYRVDALTDEGDLGFFFAPPHAVALGPQGLAPLAGPFGEISGAEYCEYAARSPLTVYLDRGGANFNCSFEMEPGETAGTGAPAGILFAVGSNGLWDINVTVVRDAHGSTVTPARAGAGNAAFVTRAEPSAASTAGFAGRHVLETDLATQGWTHVGVRSEQPVPAEARARRYEVVLPGGFAYTGEGAEVGAAVEGNGAEWSREVPDFVGTYTADPGPVRATLDYAEGGGRLDLGLVHLAEPWAKLGLEDIAGGYVGEAASAEACAARVPGAAAWDGTCSP